MAEHEKPLISPPGNLLRRSEKPGDKGSRWRLSQGWYFTLLLRLRQTPKPFMGNQLGNVQLNTVLMFNFPFLSALIVSNSKNKLVDVIACFRVEKTTTF